MWCGSEGREQVGIRVKLGGGKGGRPGLATGLGWGGTDGTGGGGRGAGECGCGGWQGAWAEAGQRVGVAGEQEKPGELRMCMGVSGEGGGGDRAGCVCWRGVRGGQGRFGQEQENADGVCGVLLRSEEAVNDVRESRKHTWMVNTTVLCQHVRCPVHSPGCAGGAVPARGCAAAAGGAAGGGAGGHGGGHGGAAAHSNGGVGRGRGRTKSGVRAAEQGLRALQHSAGGAKG